MVPVRGSVSLRGVPLTNGEIKFNPVDKSGRVATGKINMDGSFVVSTFKKDDGVAVGEYRITVASFIIDERTPAKDRDLSLGGKLAIPQKYLSVEKSGLRETITEGMDNLDIDLFE